MIIYGSSLSPFVRKLVALAREKGLEFDLKPTGRGEADPEFVKASPLRKMPALVDGDYTLADSSAIAHYLDAQYPEVPMIPADPRARGTTVWWDEYGDTILCGCGAKIFFNRVVAPLFLGREGDEAVAAKAEAEDLPPILDFLEARVPEAGAFLVGDTITLADLSVAAPLVNLEHVGLAPTHERHPRLVAWAASILSRPSFARSIEYERALLERLRG